MEVRKICSLLYLICLLLSLIFCVIGGSLKYIIESNRENYSSVFEYKQHVNFYAWHDTVPAKFMTLYAVGTVTLLGLFLLAKCLLPKSETKSTQNYKIQTFVAYTVYAIFSFSLTFLLTNAAKSHFGRGRPDMFNRCFMELGGQFNSKIKEFIQSSILDQNLTTNDLPCSTIWRIDPKHEFRKQIPPVELIVGEAFECADSTCYVLQNNSTDQIFNYKNSNSPKTGVQKCLYIHP